MRHCSLLFLIVFFVFASCSKEEIQEKSAGEVGVQEEDLDVQEGNENSTEFLKSSELLTSNFLPTFTNYHGRDSGTSTNRSSSLASEWSHEYDENDNLVKSYFFELYPHRILKEVTYLDVHDHTLKYEIKEYRYYGLLYSISDSYELTFDDNLEITGTPGQVFREFTEDGWVTKIDAVASNGSVVYQTGYEYDEQGKILKYLSYDNSGINYATVDYTYNENGDPLSYYFQNIYGAEIKVNYFYRGDNTLERLEEEYFNDDNDYGTKIFHYSAEERFAERITNRGDGSKEVVTYTEDEIIVESFQDEVLTEVFIYQITEEGYFAKLQKEYINGVLHTIKYFNAKGDVEYTEYYDEDGNLIETIYE